jgi:hypothetical protein
VAMMVSARKVAETTEQVRYEFGLDRRFDRVLVIDKATLRPSPVDGEFDTPTGAISAKLMRLRGETGEFPEGAVFAS